MKENESPKSYFYRILDAKRKGEDWAKNIPVDMNVYYADKGKVEHLRGKYDKEKTEHIVDGEKYEEVDDLPF